MDLKKVYEKFFHEGLCIQLTVKLFYRIVQNVGRVKLWQIDRSRVLARKTLANLQYKKICRHAKNAKTAKLSCLETFMVAVR